MISSVEFAVKYISSDIFLKFTLQPKEQKLQIVTIFSFSKVPRILNWKFSDIAPVGHTSIQFPHEMQFVSESDFSIAGLTIDLKPR